MFAFFTELKCIASHALKSVHIWEICITSTLIMMTFLNECEHLKHYMGLDEITEILPVLNRKIISNHLLYIFYNVQIAL